MIFNPFYEVERMRALMDRLWESFVRGEYQSEKLDFTNIYEGKDGYMFQFLAPGVNLNDVSVNCSNGVLSVEVKRKLEEQKDMRLLRNERFNIDFKRSYRLPDDVDVEKIEAKIINGLLMVYVPKKEEAKPKKISVKVS